MISSCCPKSVRKPWSKIFVEQYLHRIELPTLSMGELNQPYVKPRRAAVRDYRSIVALRIEQAQAVLAKQHR